jgi:pimeloyl-ACP methyl ester carboxylesterase
MIKNSQEPSSRSWAQAQHDAAVGFDGTSYLTHHRAPTLVVTGDQDQIIPPGNSEALVKHIKGSQKKVYPNVGHLILVEEPERFSQDVLNFLNEWSL